ncbi:putative GBF-interacting protein [Dioscorea sansibarensis]
MVLGPSLDGDSRPISLRVRRTIQSIREIVGDHSEADIYQALRESNMDPNETAQKLLNQDPFHEVRRKRDKKREITDNMRHPEARKSIEPSMKWSTPQTSQGQNVQRNNYVRTGLSGISQKFRVVRDNRVSQSGSSNNKPESVQHLAPDNKKVASNDQRNAGGNMPPLPVNASFDKLTKRADEADASESHLPQSSEGNQRTIHITTSQVESMNENNSRKNSATLLSTLSLSSSCPVHVPSDSEASKTIGTIRCEAGVMSVQGHTSAHLTSTSSTKPFSRCLLGKDKFSSTGFSVHFTSPYKSNKPSQRHASEPVTSGLVVRRTSSRSHYTSKPSQQSMGPYKATQVWRPRSGQKPVSTNGVVAAAISVSSTSCVDDNSCSNDVVLTGLSEKLTQINVSGDERVIIPQHLRVPESLMNVLAFGSFAAETLSHQPLENAKLDEKSTLSPTSAQVNTRKDNSQAEQGDPVDCKPGPCQSDPPSPVEEPENFPPQNDESYNAQNIESYADIGLVESNSPLYDLSTDQQVHHSSSMANFMAYDSRTDYDVAFLGTSLEDIPHDRGFVLTSEALGSHDTSSNPLSVSTMIQQPIQQQPVTQVYPPVQISHYPNFIPYRHVLSPVYMPSMPNYSSNSAFPHPSSGNGYMLMPGAGSHLTSGGMKYAASHYKLVPSGSATGFGNYTNTAGFTISTSGTIGTAIGLDDMTRIKYKDNSIYIPNPQADLSDIWVQTPREITGLQSTPFYNVQGQAPPSFMPTHAGHASFNAPAQSPHLPFQGLYSPQAHPHHLVNPQVPPGLGGNIGVGVAAPGPQLGSYQQPQISHLNWAPNF